VKWGVWGWVRGGGGGGWVGGGGGLLGGWGGLAVRVGVSFGHKREVMAPTPTPPTEPSPIPLESRNLQTATPLDDNKANKRKHPSTPQVLGRVRDNVAD